MALRYNGSPQPTSAAHQHHITGQYLARAHLTRRQRTRLAAELANGAAVLSPPTVKQAAALARVSVFDVSKARRNGKHSNRRSNGHEETLAAHMERTSPAEWQSAARIYGVDRIWDQMIAPVIAEERANQQAAE
jgi:hypothetical protein